MRKIRVPVQYQKLKNDGASPVELFVRILQDKGFSSALDYVAVLFAIDEESEEMKVLINEAYTLIFKPYILLRDQGYSAESVVKEARKNGLSGLDLLSMVGIVFDYSVVEIKETILRSDGTADSLSEYQGRFVKALEQLEEEEISDFD